MVYPACNNYQLSHEIANEAGHLILRDGAIWHNNIDLKLHTSQNLRKIA